MAQDETIDKGAAKVTRAEIIEELLENWQVALIGFCVLFFGFSAPAYALPFLYPEVIEEFGWSRSTATSLASVKYLTGAIACVVVGRIIDMVGVWAALSGCIIIGALALLSFLAVSDLQTYLAVGVLLGIAGPGVMVSVFVLIARCFRQSQGTATGIVLLGTGLGGFAMPLIISFAIEIFGWRNGMAVLSLGIWVIAVPLLIYGMRRVSLPDDHVTSSKLKSAGTLEVTALRHLSGLAKTRNFWLMTFAFLFVTVADQALTQHQVLMFTDAKLSEGVAALAVSLIGLFSMLGRIVAGSILDGWSNKGLTVLYLTLSLSAVLALFLFNPLILIAFVAVRALAHASSMIDGPVLARHTFGTTHLGVLLGLFTAFANLGSAGGPWILGAMYDASGSYDSALWLLIVLPAFSALLIFLVVPKAWLSQRESLERKPAPERHKTSERQAF